ncbi:MAG TPA: DUF1559 domain-containing protein [Phycisphaerae bacterium]|nr:DUF1559 domain-containing protein [Phycisphaerae bacterium]HNU46038.1 DUF1559 domain-containing protein [Phycisphaerae bacterium]
MRKRNAAFSLVELLVVIAIVALLLSVLLPGLSGARQQARRVACGSQLRQIGTAIHLYAGACYGRIPCGPGPQHPYDFSGNHVATNQIWTADEDPPGPHPPDHYVGLGVLLRTVTTEAKLLYCPADDNLDIEEELPKLGTGADAYCSYLYRQLDQLPTDAGAGQLDRLGTNVIDDVPVPVEALVLDINSLGPGELFHTNHEARLVNILFRDGSVRCFTNKDNVLALAREVFANPMAIPAAIDQLLTNADYAYRHVPTQAPRLAP